MRIRYYLRNYIEFVKLNIQTWAEYRVDFILGITAIFLTNITAIVFFWVIFQHIPTLNGWTLHQLLFIFGFWAFTAGIWHVFLTGAAPWAMDRLVRRGELDREMLRPMNTLLLILIRRIDDDGFGDMTAGIILLVYTSSVLGITWTPQLLLAFAALSAGSVLVLFSINLLISAAAFWVTTVRSLLDMFWNLTRFVEYPIDIYSASLVLFLTYIFPLGFTAFYPAQYFLGRVEWMSFAYATPIVGLLMLGISYAAWSHGLKNYTSVGH